MCIRDSSAGGSIDEWLWKGSGNSQKAYIVAELGRQSAASRLMYLLGFAKVGYRFEIVTEMIDTSESDHYFYSFSKGQAFIIDVYKRQALLIAWHYGARFAHCLRELGEPNPGESQRTRA